MLTNVLVGIIMLLMIGCSVISCLYFKARNTANDNEMLASLWNRRYLDMTENRDMYMHEEGKAKSKIYELEDAIKDKDSLIKLLKQRVDARTINYTRTTVAAKDANGNIAIPREIFKDEDPAESSLFYAAAWDTIVNLIAKDILNDSTIFNIKYDIRNDTYCLCYYYKKFLSREYRSNGYRIEPWSESPVKELVERIRKQEGDEDGQNNN